MKTFKVNDLIAFYEKDNNSKFLAIIYAKDFYIFSGTIYKCLILSTKRQFQHRFLYENEMKHI